MSVLRQIGPRSQIISILWRHSDQNEKLFNNNIVFLYNDMPGAGADLCWPKVKLGAHNSHNL
jgi:hypothetical protein